MMLCIVLLADYRVLYEAVGHGLLLEGQLVQVLLVVSFSFDRAAAARGAHGGGRVAAILLNVLGGETLRHVVVEAAARAISIVVLIHLSCLWRRQYRATLRHYDAARTSSLVVARSARRRRPAATVLTRVRMRGAKTLGLVLSPAALKSLDPTACTFFKWWLRWDLLLPDHHVVAFQAEGHQRRGERPFLFTDLDTCRHRATLVIVHAKLLLLGAAHHFVFLV